MGDLPLACHTGAVHPLLSKVEATPDHARHRITLVDDAGGEVHAEMEIREVDGVLVGNPDPDIFRHWDGDAESVRQVVAAVVALHRARRVHP